MKIDETPEKWVIVKIENNNTIFYKVFCTWAGGYLGSDRWKFNSGIDKVTQDNDYYYFIGFSGSCYKCHKAMYGVITSYGLRVLNDIIENSDDKAIVLDDTQDWASVINLKILL
jgi:hypothetical protein